MPTISSSPRKGVFVVETYVVCPSDRVFLLPRYRSSLTGGHNSLFIGECHRGVFFRKEVAIGLTDQFFRCIEPQPASVCAINEDDARICILEVDIILDIDHELLNHPSTRESSKEVAFAHHYNSLMPRSRWDASCASPKRFGRCS
jgi:hypothetical protein